MAVEVNENLSWPGRGGAWVNYITNPPGKKFAAKATRNLTILGSTGSVGTNALIVAEKGDFRIRGLAGGKNVQLLAAQAKKFRPAMLAVSDYEGAVQLSQILKHDPDISIFYGVEGFNRLASDSETDCVLSAQMGSAGLDATLAAALNGKMIALANKESLVLAGGLLRKICAVTGASILPVDSEHYALFQCAAGKGQLPSHFILTASGGPFIHKDKKEFHQITPEMALAHPNWSMGKKITIDSATLFNKGLEYIEAIHLFGLAPDNISVVIHPQSIIHSLVQFRDNSLLAQLAVPDMKLPISACLYWPFEQISAVAKLDLVQIGKLTFASPDEGKFACLALAKEAALWKGSGNWQIYDLNPAAIVLSSANEIAVSLFLNNQCRFDEIEKIIALALQNLIYDQQPFAQFDGDYSIEALALHGLANIRALEARTINFIMENWL